MKITDVAVKHSVSVYVLIFVLLIGGMLAYASLPREAAPEIEMPVILVSTVYMGVSPEDIESLITRPIEQELKEITDIDKLTSTSAESASIITIQFTSDVDLDEAKQEVRDKVDLARPKLPKDAEDPVIKAISTSDFPVMIVNVSGPYSIVKLRQVAEDVQDKIEAINGVLEVKLAGGVEREIQVRVDPALLNHYGIPLEDVTQAVSGENVNMPGGDVKVGDASFLVRVPGEYKSVDEIRSIVVKMRGGVPVHLYDLAEVRDSFKERDSISRLDGSNNVSLTVTKRPGANLLHMADDIKALLRDIQPTLPAGTQFTILNDASKDINSMVKELENNIISGLILVVLVIVVGMGLRNSLLVGVAIPLSMLISFLVLSLLDITLNMIVLFSLILALGMLVDNAIVIVENIYRHAGMGKDKIRAAMEGTGEVAWPVLTSTLTTVAAFAPVMFWPGIMGEFMGYLPRTLIITLLASLFVALVITPVLAAAFIKPEQKLAPEEGRQSTRGARWRARYERALRSAIAHRWRTVAVGAVMFIGTLVVFGLSNLGVEFFPEVTPRKIFLQVNAGDGSRLDLSNRIVQRIEEGISSLQNIEHYVADVGTGGGDPGMGGSSNVPHLSRVSIDFLEEDARVEPVEHTLDAIRRWISDIPGARIEMQKERMGPPTGAPINIEIYGEDFQVLGELAQQIRAQIAHIKGVVDLKDDYQAGRPEIRINVDREMAKVLGADIMKIANTVRTAINGQEASVLRDGEDEYDITVRLAEDFRNRLDDIEALRINVPSPTDPAAAVLIPIGQVASIEAGGGQGSIRHKDLKRVVTVSANVEGDLPPTVLAKVQAQLADFKMPLGYSLAYTGEDEESQKAQAFLGKAFLVALFLIFLILVTQFNSIMLPAIIMLAVVLSLVGVFWGQIILQMPFGVIMTGLGVISLAGIVVNNAIVLMDYIQQTRAQGVPRDEALVQAGLVRLRPVLLTAVTTVLGLIPMALGVSFDFSSATLQIGGRSADFWRSMSVAVIFGLVIATVLTLVVVPVLYSLFDDFEQWVRRVILRQGTGASLSPSPSPSPGAARIAEESP